MMLEIRALKSSMTQQEIMNKIPAETLAKIKSSDANPFFQAYVLCHEGDANPTVLGAGGKTIKFLREAIQSFKNIVLEGVKFFAGHNKDSSTENRKEIGEVIHSFEDNVNGKLSRVVISYHDKSVRDEVKNYDVCSQEALWHLEDRGNVTVAEKIEKLTGIALANSKTEKPAFAGAKRLGQLYAFGEIASGEPAKKEKKMTFQELKQHIQEMNVFPSQLYSIDQIKKDREFADIFVGQDKVAEQLKQSEEKIKQLTKDNQKQTAKNRIKEYYKSQNISEKAQTYIDSVYEITSEEMTDLSDEALSKFVSKQNIIYDKITPAINSDENLNLNDGDTGQSSNTPDYTNPEYNELLE